MADVGDYPLATKNSASLLSDQVENGTAEAPDCAPTGWTNLVLDVNGSPRGPDGTRIFYGHHVDVLPGLIARQSCTKPSCGIETNLPLPTETPPG